MYRVKLAALQLAALFCNMPRARGTAISLLGCRKKESGSDVSWKHEVDQ